MVISLRDDEAMTRQTMCRILAQEPKLKKYAKKIMSEEESKEEENIIKWLENRFDYIEDSHERTKFILAAYNVGPGHIYDARNLAMKNGANPDIWDDNVDKFLLSKSDPEVYKDPIVKYGYCRGIETYNYVKDILERYQHYKNIIEG